MATVYDPLLGYYAVDDKLLEEDANTVREVAIAFHGWYAYQSLRSHFKRQPSDLTPEQRDRLKYYDDIISRVGQSAL